MNDVDAIIVGAGLGGLATAVRLQAAGYRTIVCESRDRPGGRAYRLEDQGYTWDMGPTLLTLPSLFRELWNAAGGNFDEDIQLIPLRPYYRVILGDGRFIDYGSEDDRQAVHAFSAEDAERVPQFFDAVRSIYGRAFEELANRPFLSMKDFIVVVPDLIRLGAYRSVFRMVSHYFRDDNVRALFSFHPLFIGGNPLRASAVYSIVPHIERNEGVWYVRGGTYEIVKALVRRYEALGGVVRTKSPVEHMIVDSRRVTGVVLASGEIIRARAVISNADVANTYLHLLPKESRPRIWSWRLPRMRYSMSCFLLYLGLRRRFPDAVHHTIVIPWNYKAAIRDVFDGRGLPRHLAFYVHTPSRTDPTVAPPGGETMYVLVPVPHEGRGIDWTRDGEGFRDRIIEEIERVPEFRGLREAIAVEHRFTPADFARELRSYRGAAFSIEPTLFQSAVFRPHNRSEVSGLYFVGAGTHPGAGMPGVLLSAAITARLVQQDLVAPSFRRSSPIPVARRR